MGLRDTSVHSDPVLVCKFGRLIAGLDDDDRTVLFEWVLKRGFGVPRVYSGLREAGFEIGSDVIGRHFRGECGCATAQDVLYKVRPRG